MNNLIESCIHFSNLSYTNTDFIRLSLSDNINLEDYKFCDRESIKYIKEKKLVPTINYKLNIGLPNILYCNYNNKLFISFPGISTNSDRLNCLNFKLKYNEELECYIHGGFTHIFNKLKSEIELIIDVFSNTYDEIIFTGHSLGASIAKYSALYFKMYKDINISCITFACPLMGDNTFIEQFDKHIIKTFTLCCQKDFLVKIPFHRYCSEKRKYMIDINNNIVLYKDICNSYIYNFIKLNIATHRLEYYMKILLNVDFQITLLQ